jgi:hypothetical protein
MFFSSTASALAGPSITVNLPSRTIELFSDNKLIKEFPVAIGKASTPTPLGDYSIILKEVNPTWYIPQQPGKFIPSGPDNPLGYRWMGFWKDYGIHGTNVPESIGNSVSNGCIRMYEENVEELFELVNYGTPVKITYDQVKVRRNASGQITLAIYPDIYGYGSITLQDIRNKLNDYRISELVTDNFLQKMLDDPSDQQVVIASQFKIQIGGKLLTEQGLALQNVRYVPISAVTGMLNRQVKWDEKNKTLQYGTATVPGIVVDKVAYISSDNLTAIFASKPNWNPDENTLIFTKQGVYVNDKPINIEVIKLQGILAVPVLPLAEAMGRKISWNKENQIATLTDKGKNVAVPITMVDNVPYIKITSINEYFDAYVYWNQKANTIDLTYP